MSLEFSEKIAPLTYKTRYAYHPIFTSLFYIPNTIEYIIFMTRLKEDFLYYYGFDKKIRMLEHRNKKLNKEGQRSSELIVIQQKITRMKELYDWYADCVLGTISFFYNETNKIKMAYNSCQNIIKVKPPDEEMKSTKNLKMQPEGKQELLTREEIREQNQNYEDMEKIDNIYPSLFDTKFHSFMDEYENAPSEHQFDLCFTRGLLKLKTCVDKALQIMKPLLDELEDLIELEFPSMNV
jgi:hypothetical protein